MRVFRCVGWMDDPLGVSRLSQIMSTRNEDGFYGCSLDSYPFVAQSANLVNDTQCRKFVTNKQYFVVQVGVTRVGLFEA